MKKTIKLLSMLLCLSLLFSCFTACNKSTNESGSSKTDEPVMFEDKITIGDEKLTLPAVSMKLEGETLTLPCTVQEYAEQLEFFGYDNNIAEIELAPQEEKTMDIGDFIFSGITPFREINVCNYSDSSLSLKDCIIVRIYANCDDYEKIEFPIGFNVKDAKPKDVIDAFGEPTMIEREAYTYYKEENGWTTIYVFSFNKELDEEGNYVVGKCEELMLWLYNGSIDDLL